MNTLQLGLIQGNLRCFGANCNMSRNTRFLCYFFLLEYSSVLYFTLFPSLIENTIMNREQMDCRAISQSLGCMRSIMFQLARSLIALVNASLENPMARGGHFHSAIQSQSLIISLNVCVSLYPLSTFH